MRRIIVAAAVVVSMVSMSNAQKLELGIDGGYGLGAGEDLQNPTYTNDVNGTAVTWKDVYGSGGNGVKIMAEAAFFLNENIGIMAMAGYSMNGGFTSTQTYNDFTIVYKTTASYVPVNLGLKIRAKLGNIMPYVYMAPGLYFPKEKTNRTWTNQPDDNKTYTFAMGFGFTAGVGAALMISDNIGVKLEVNPTYAFANVKQMTDDNGILGTTTTFYQNDTPTPTLNGTNTVYQHGQPRISFSSVALRLGVFIDL